MGGPLPATFYNRTAALIAAVFLGLIATACWINFVSPRPVDFLSFWAAAQMALEGQGAAAYDIIAHRSIELSAAPLRGLMPFPYPPPFLLIVTPFGMLPYKLAFAVWILVTGLLYAFAAARHFRPAIALAFPSVLSNGLVGQNGFLTSAIFLFGTRWLDAWPILAGATLGLMVIKPQLAILLPVALIAGRHWRVLAATALSSLLLLALALMAFGADAYRGFLGLLPVYTEFMSAGRWSWNELASAFALLRYLSIPAAAALTVHAALAAIATGIVWRAWRLRWHNRLAILAAATVLVPPYLFSYDALLLVLPFTSTVLDNKRRWLAPIVWLLSALPLASNFGLFDGPNTLPLAAVVLLVAMVADEYRSAPPTDQK